MIFFRFRMKPRIPIKNRINDKFMIVYLILMDQCINIVNYVTVKNKIFDFGAPSLKIFDFYSQGQSYTYKSISY